MINSTAHRGGGGERESLLGPVIPQQDDNIEAPRTPGLSQGAQWSALAWIRRRTRTNQGEEVEEEEDEDERFSVCSLTASRMREQ
jgi:hypothetical protein